MFPEGFLTKILTGETSPRFPSHAPLHNAFTTFITQTFIMENFCLPSRAQRHLKVNVPSVNEFQNECVYNLFLLSIFFKHSWNSDQSYMIASALVSVFNSSAICSIFSLPSSKPYTPT